MTKKITAGLSAYIQQQLTSIGVRSDCPLCNGELRLDDQLTSILTEHFIAQDYLALVCMNCYHVMWIVAFPYMNGWEVDPGLTNAKPGNAGSNFPP